MRRIKLRRKISKINILLIIILLLIFCLILVFKFINKRVNPLLMNYAELESKKIASIIINEAINKNITSNIKIDELFIITKDDKVVDSISGESEVADVVTTLKTNGIINK